MYHVTLQKMTKISDQLIQDTGHESKKSASVSSDGWYNVKWYGFNECGQIAQENAMPQSMLVLLD